ANVQQAQNNVNIFSKVLFGGILALAAGGTFTWWGEDILAGIQLLLGAALFFSPLYLPSLGVDPSKPAAQDAMGALRNGGLILGVIGLLVLVIDLATKAR